jgi:hypothetical protein
MSVITNRHLLSAMRRTPACFLLVCFVTLQACSTWSSRLSTQQVAAYSVATGFLVLCDFNDFKGALDLYGGPIKSHSDGAIWVTTTKAKRAPFGPPILRTWMNRQDLNDSANLTFQFRTSFPDQPSADEVVSVTRTSGRWQVYDYKFHALGKPSVTSGPSQSPLPSPRSPRATRHR